MRKITIVGQMISKNYKFLCPLLSCCESNKIRRFLSNENRSGPIKMSYKEFGESHTTSDVPIVIMHGLFGSKMNWNYVSKEIHTALQRKVFTVDARNHGDSPHTPDHSYLLLAQDLKAFLQERNIDKAVLIGHSMGGRAVMYFTLTNPHLVDRLVVCDISPVGTGRGFQEMNDIIQAIRDVNLNELANLKNISQARMRAEKLITEKLKLDRRIANYLVTNLREDGSGGYSWRVNLDAIHKNYDPHITVFPLPENAHYDGQTLFVVGKQGDFVKPEEHDEIRRIFPKVKFLELDAGHWVHADKPQEFIAGVCDFLKSS
ncbi:protein ABHD11 [Nilaparvata lugens]|uniref:protein ABHD11 n=1 Tax=Nilaparvata lugens TaxID=108931 RepID=UPI00193DFA08|nr:protein ABHD11 [Nilaparvata lugens]